MSEPVLVVDLDGTLLRSDLLIESTLSFVREHPLAVFKPLYWLTRGKAHLKQEIAARSDIDVAVLPYEPAVLEQVREARAQGRKTVLATASDQALAQRVAGHLQLFDEVLASDGHTNLSRTRKRDALVRAYGEKGFDYLGNAHDDLVVWRAARDAWLVNPLPGVRQRAERDASINVAGELHAYASRWRAWLHALRVHQWLKNLLIFVPLLTAHKLTDLVLVQHALLAFLFYGLCASSVYLLNDLLDLNDDRHHPRKRQRPFASGALSPLHGLVATPLLLVSAFAGALWLLPWHFAAVMAGYYVITLAYSLALKRLMTIDVVTLALLYTLRIIAGGAATGVHLTFWILAFSMFIFLSLALIKRYAELFDAREAGNTGKSRGRGYYPSDLPMLASLGAAAGYLAVMILALYIYDQTTVALYRHPEVIWLACPLLLLWITRAWMLAHRGEMHDDPVVFAVRDRFSLVIGALFGLVFWIAL